MSKFIRKRAKVDYVCISPTPSPEPEYADDTSDTEETICEKAFRISNIKYCLFCSATDEDDVMRIFTECSQCGWVCNECHVKQACPIIKIKQSLVSLKKTKKQKLSKAYKQCPCDVCIIKDCNHV
jgi:hypothetical protein